MEYSVLKKKMKENECGQSYESSGGENPDLFGDDS
jgi:hypothetical protein